MMEITINNKKEIIPDNITVAELIKQKNLRGNCSVWVNEKHLLLQEYDTFVIQANDDVKIIVILGGG